MKSLVLYFNPKKALKKQGRFFTAFCFAPEAKAEYQLGWLDISFECLVIGLLNIEGFSQEVISLIKNEFYSSAETDSEEALKTCLARANQFIANRLKNKELIESLNMAVLALSPALSLYLAKAGKIKIVLLRGKEIFDLSKNNTDWQVEKTFQNIIKGGLNKGDRLMIASPSVFEALYDREIIQGLSALPAKPQLIKKCLKTHKALLRQLSGFLLFVLTKPKKMFFVPSLPKTKPFRLILYLVLLGLLLLLGSLIF